MAHAFIVNMRLAFPLLIGLCFAPLPAAAAPFLVAELHTGLAESTVAQGDPMLAYGATVGATFKVPGSPLRFYLLGNVTQRSARFTNRSTFGLVALDRQELDLVLSARLILPIWGPVRVFGEFGVGRRGWGQSLALDGATFSEDNQGLIWTAALGVQTRLSERFSVGGKLAFDRATQNEPLLESVGLTLTGTRMAFMGHVGVHF